ncbi:MAG: hypothetical protein HYW26_02350 [Candidatus Aenigmarchaeota archaeon]|nr:hypothetical protein [Candidatus Aenigmarchaeota archaeon]
MNIEKKRLFALFIIGTFILSTIAFVFVGLAGRAPEQERQKAKTLTSYVIAEDVDSATEAEYVSRGYTFLKFYYNETAPLFLDGLPSAMMAGNDMQLFVLKIRDTQNYARIVNVQNDVELKNLTEENITNELCIRLIVTPLECSLRNVS